VVDVLEQAEHLVLQVDLEGKLHQSITQRQPHQLALK
jgi:hypothetical protein